MNPRAERLVRLERWAKRQEWVISVAQLYSLSFSHEEIRGMVDRRYLHRLHRGVYAVGHRQLTRRGWLFAALLACGDECFLSHRTAVGIKGLCPINPYAIHVTVIGSRSRRHVDLIIHRARVEPQPGEVTTSGGLRVSTIYRALVESAADEPPEWLGEIIEAGIRRRLIDVPKLEKTIAAHPGARGMTKLKAALTAYRPRPFDKFGLERSVAAAIAADPSIPPPKRNIRHTTGGITWELDFFWEEQRVVLETDGSQYHLTPQDKERDRIKDAKLMAQGITPLRVTDVRWELDPGGAMDDLRAILGAASSSKSA